MEDFLHVRPPFTLGAPREGLLTGHAFTPPLLGNRVGRHLGAIRLEVVADVLEVAEQVVLAVREFAQENGVVTQVAVLDHLQDLGPHRGVQFFVAFDALRGKSYNGRDALHAIPPVCE